MPRADVDRGAALALLGLTTRATADQITAAYRRLARATHPDVCPEAGASVRFAALTDAYRTALTSIAPATPTPTARPVSQPTSVGPSGPTSWICDVDAAQRDVPLVAGPVHVVPWSRRQRQGER